MVQLPSVWRLVNVVQKFKGGAGSGNFGHEGIPGHVGGSAPSAELVAAFSIYQGLVEPYSVSDAAEQAIVWYQAPGGYKQINRTLRQNLEPSKNVTNALKHIDDSFTETTRDAKVYKGISYTEAHKELFQRGGAPVGATLKDNGYWSTTTSPLVAGKFSHNNTVLSIDLPKGSKVLPVDGVVKNDPHFGKNQHELLLPRGSSFAIKGEHREGPGGNLRVIELELQQ